MGVRHKANLPDRCPAAPLKLVHLLPKGECLNEQLFDGLADARQIIKSWRADYKGE